MGLSLLQRPEKALALRFSVPADPVSLRVVRRSVDAIADFCGQEVTDRLAVIFSELVTNAIRHAGVRPDDILDVSLDISRDGIRGQVVDPGRGFDPDALPARREDEEGGFGLHIVDKLASTWGVAQNGHSTVWFRL